MKECPVKMAGGPPVRWFIIIILSLIKCNGSGFAEKSPFEHAQRHLPRPVFCVDSDGAVENRRISHLGEMFGDCDQFGSKNDSIISVIM